MASLAIFLNSSTPAAAPGYQNAQPQTDGGVPLTSVSLGVPNTGGVAVKSASYTATASDCGKLLVFNSAVAVTLTLPASIPFPQWTVVAANIGAGALTISPGSRALDGASAISAAQFQSMSIFTDGANYFSARGIGTAGSGGGGGSSTTHDEVLTDGQNNIIFGGGDVITVLGVPN
ncbi:MAG TPA: hypothetical protein VGP83_17305 [Pyrinomonadaceae bacterium]|jgi:hypothetical protein|nr:hypothetical protein [Pyrinomonadaceae bacterium]